MVFCMARKPRIAIILDENTSEDASRYELSKGCFTAIRDAGGLPFGIAYLPELVTIVLEEFDGLLCTGGRFAYPVEWYLGNQPSKAPASERLDIETRIIEGYLERDKPVLGLCAGMQLLAGVHGCRLWSDVSEHDKNGYEHLVSIIPNTRLAGLVGASELLVNTSHREAIGEVSQSVLISARSDDGVIEAIEIPGKHFAIGLQWHQERYAGSGHPGNGVFRGFIEACGAA
jgi:putative glutamine amidotransferase